MNKKRAGGSPASRADLHLPDETLTMTKDTGAAENVVGHHMSPGTAMRPSAGSRCGVQYTSADGNSMPNRGEKEVNVATGEGQKCVLKV